MQVFIQFSSSYSKSIFFHSLPDQPIKPSHSSSDQVEVHLVYFSNPSIQVFLTSTFTDTLTKTRSDAANRGGGCSSSPTVQSRIVRLARINYDVLLLAPSLTQEAANDVTNSRAFNCTMPGAQNPSSIGIGLLVLPLLVCPRTRQQRMSIRPRCALDSTTAVLAVWTTCTNAAVAPTARLATRREPEHRGHATTMAPPRARPANLHPRMRRLSTLPRNVLHKEVAIYAPRIP
ncbi:hypothetical protein C8R45DRAFT_934184 [Mycena sanguinolenta]|nr:hypothetical protein C8R45DRAFT_934184 [Mycena sanguinolenta]